MAVYTVMISEKNKKMLIVDGFKFGFQKYLANHVERWTCVQRGCKAFLKLDSSGALIQKNDEHGNHTAVNVSVLQRQQFSNNIKRQATDNPHEAPAKIVRRQLLQGDVKTLTAVDLRRVRRNVQRARAKLRPVLPKTLGELHDALRYYALFTNHNEQFLFMNDETKNVVAFSCKTNLTYLRQVKTIYVDGTFKTCPKLFYQLFTVHSVSNDVYAPPSVFLLPGKSVGNYTDALKALQNYIQPVTVYSDFERSIQLAVSEVWPTADLRGCRFHLGQSWWRKIQSLRLTEEYQNKESEIEIRVLRYIFGLPLLAPEGVKNCFLDLMAVKPTVERLDNFFDYLLMNYIVSYAQNPPSL